MYLSPTVLLTPNYSHASKVMMHELLETLTLFLMFILAHNDIYIYSTKELFKKYQVCHIYNFK